MAKSRSQYMAEEELIVGYCESKYASYSTTSTKARREISIFFLAVFPPTYLNIELSKGKFATPTCGADGP